MMARLGAWCHDRRRLVLAAQRRVTAGNSKRDAIRCLKRYLARELYNDVQAIVTTSNPRAQIAA